MHEANGRSVATAAGGETVAAGTGGNFANPTVITRTWFVVARSRQIRAGRARTVSLLNRRIVLFRSDTGTVHALDATCAHLGADLGMGRVCGDQIECPFHGWRYGADGRCHHAPGLATPPQRRVRAYPTREQWGLVWIFNGPAPDFEIPGPPAGDPHWHLLLPSRHIDCHPHLVIANGLDDGHFGPLHNFEQTAPPQLHSDGERQVSLTLHGRPRSPWLQRFTSSRRRAIRARFTTIGGNLALAAIDHPFQFHVLFTGRLSETGGCHTQVIFFFPYWVRARAVQALLIMGMLLHDDSRILNGLSFRAGFTPADQGLRAVADAVNRMQRW